MLGIEERNVPSTSALALRLINFDPAQFFSFFILGAAFCPFSVELPVDVTLESAAPSSSFDARDVLFAAREGRKERWT